MGGPLSSQKCFYIPGDSLLSRKLCGSVLNTGVNFWMLFYEELKVGGKSPECAVKASLYEEAL